ncbi:MAG: carboxypeptidase regulatory-like domain-containing protein [Blastocatellia bacterium]
MKKSVHILIAGCVFGMFAAAPVPQSGIGLTAVEAAPVWAIVTGTVKDDRGLPLAGAIVSVLEAQHRGKELKSVKTDTQGRFSTGILPGVYRLRASAEGFLAGLARVNLDRPVKLNYDFALKRTDTLIEKRGDSDDYRWIARSVPRHAMNLREDETEEVVPQTGDASMGNGFAERRPEAAGKRFHGMMQMVAAGGASRPGLPGSFYGTNFAVSVAIGDNLEMALIGQQGVGQLAPQRLAAIASLRPGDSHQITASIGYGQVGLARRLPNGEPMLELGPDGGSRFARREGVPVRGATGPVDSLEQLSVSAIGSWQVFQPLIVIYGFDYSRFVGSPGRESLLPRLAVQYAPSARTRLNAAITPGTDQYRNPDESFNTENIQASFDTSTMPMAMAGAPLLDRSRRIETGFERLFGEGETSIATSAFYDLISSHGVGVLALPLEASPETQATFHQFASQVASMNGAARGMRVMLRHRFGEYVTGSAGYSVGRGSRFNRAPIDSLSPARFFQGGLFQVATAKLDFDLSHKTGTRISTVFRLSPQAVVFAIDPFAGQMSVYDPNINIYLTQELPNFGLPVRWQAVVDLRNLLDQPQGVEDGAVQLVTAQSRRTVRGGLAFRW